MFTYSADFPSLAVRENLDRVSEKIIQAIWHYLFLRMDNLKTTDGRPVKILDQGIWNHDAGPDFRSAKIKIGEEAFSGDIEIHWRSSDWRHHEHQENSAYQNIILHAVFTDDEPLTGKAFPTLELRNYLNDNLWRLSERIQALELNRKNIFCYEDIPAFESDFICAWVLENGRRRFRAKVEKFRTMQDQNQLDYHELTYRGMLDALGYSKNREPFRRLAELVSYKQLLTEIKDDKDETALMRVQAILLGAAGLLETVQNKTGDLAIVPFFQRLDNLWTEFQHQFQVRSINASGWKLFRLRPSNFPTLRMAGFSRFLITHREQKLFSIFKNKFLEASDDRVWIGNLLETLRVPAFGYWGQHYVWGDKGNHGQRDLMGAQRAFEIIVNVILPILSLYFAERKKGTLVDRILRIYSAMPSRETNASVRYMKSQLLRNSRSRTFSMQFIQGLMHLHKRCVEYNCAECPVFEKTVKRNFS
jgi:hypothetical protein